MGLNLRGLLFQKYKFVEKFVESKNTSKFINVDTNLTKLLVNNGVKVIVETPAELRNLVKNYQRTSNLYLPARGNVR